ncbi:MAG: MFS transporter, partial [Legionellales bacterium]
HFSWHWIFWVNAPIGLLALVLGLFLLPPMPAQPVYKLDKIGFLLFGSGLAGLTLGLSTLSESDVRFIYSLSIIGLALVLLACYTWHSSKRPHPIVRVELLGIRTFRVAVLGNLLARLGFGGVPFVLPLLLQIGLGFSPQSSGFLLAPTALGVLIIKPLSLRILRFFGYKYLLLLNTVLVGISLCSFTFINQHSSMYLIGFLTFLYGFLISLQYTGMNSLAYANIKPEDISAATSIMSTAQQLAQSFGVAAAAVIINLFSNAFSGSQSLTVATFHYTFFTLGLITLCSVVLFIQLKQDDGQELIGERESLKV